MKKELAALGSAAPLLASLGLTGLAIGGAAALTIAIINVLKDMALTDKDLEAIGKLIDKKLEEKLQPLKNDVKGLHQRLKGFSEFWVADTAEKYIKGKYKCSEIANSVITLENPLRVNIETENKMLPTLEIDRIFYFKCPGRRKNKVVILEITETLTANMLNHEWKKLPETKLYKKERGFFKKKMEKEKNLHSEKIFKAYLKLYNKLLYKFGRTINGVPIKEFYKTLAKEKLGINDKEVEYIFYYGAMRIPDKEAVMLLADKLGVGILRISSGLGTCNELVSPKAF